MRNLFVAIIVSIAVLGAVATAMPQRVTAQHLVYYPPPPPPPTYIRVRRQSLGGSLTSNPAGGADARVDLTKAIGTEQHNLVGQVFAAGNTLGKGPITTGGTLAYNNNGHGLQLTKTHTPGVRDSFTQSANANLFNNGVHKLDAKAFASQNQLANGLKFERNGAGLDYSHINGHGASLTHSNIPGFGKQLELGGRANLWQSQDRNTRLDLGGTASKWMSGPLSGQKDFGANLGLTHYFG
ncbi:attacin-C [Scaptodrosophila lebanonensis]|uniref:Attacin-C n=1 Tax=Drosophila lebanonensis TaxID=7225 RepID=A0A6J2TWD9_DROLE|nr:attacin-C [Scaptodrosophila lebanonensis]